jgi:UDP-N-acetylmuramoyl-L-alanyl-D-glutamate--2,6-diaminopimelate ligase
MNAIDSTNSLDVAAILAALTLQGATIRGLSTDSREIRPGMAFAAYPGGKQDGRQHIASAVQAGAEAVLWEADGYAWDTALAQVPNVPVHPLKQHISAIAAQIYGAPSRHLWNIGVTGTNGKTSCTHWIAQSFHELGRRTAILGTLGNGIYPDLTDSKNTTADAAVLQATLAGYRQAGVQALAMEVSSEGLDQGRVNAVHFDVAVLTNLSRDHLDYHGDMAHYAAVKAKLFDWPGLRYAVINQDDEFGQKLIHQSHGATEVLSYGFGQATVRGSALHLSAEGLSLRVDTPWGGAQLHAPVLGRFNASNLLATLGALLVSGVNLDQAVEHLAKVKGPEGRMQILGGKNQPWVVIDYAHTPDALQNVLLTLRELVSDSGHLYCVVGCGGDRDAGKRPEMGAIAAHWADHVVLTSDNPRSEDPLAIITAMRTRMSGNESVEVSRANAIAQSIAQAKAGDVVLIAGKGHERYQEIAGIKHPFWDYAHAQHALEICS